MLFCRILVLKDGQIVEQGSHRVLLALDGIFASMWADQVSSDDPAQSIEDTSIKGEVSGYVVDDREPIASEQEGKQDTTFPAPYSPAPISSADAVPESSLAATVPAEDQLGHTESDRITFPKSETDSVGAQVATSDSTDAPVSSGPVVAEHLTFPTTEADSSQPPPLEPIAPIQGPAVTFGENVNPPRTGTPDHESETKRKRLSSQNFQRLARRISLTTRRQSSTSILPSLKRDNSPRVSTEGRAEGSIRTESPAGSIKGDDKAKLKKKDKKEQKEKSRKASV